MASTDYRGLVVRAAHVGPDVVHLIRDDAEAALCGIPRGALGPGGPSDQIICVDCIDWLTKRRAASARLRAVKRP